MARPIPLLALLLVFSVCAGARPALAVFASPINAGCYIAAEDDCRVHIEPYAVNVNDGAGGRLVLVRMFLNGQLVYDFRTDVSNPPGDYTLTSPALDIAARCGESYVLNAVAQDTLDTNPLNAGQTAQFTCPSVVP